MIFLLNESIIWSFNKIILIYEIDFFVFHCKKINFHGLTLKSVNYFIHCFLCIIFNGIIPRFIRSKIVCIYFLHSPFKFNLLIAGYKILLLSVITLSPLSQKYILEIANSKQSCSYCIILFTTTWCRCCFY